MDAWRIYTKKLGKGSKQTLRITRYDEDSAIDTAGHIARNESVWVRIVRTTVSEPSRWA